jgi:hypothetical protein
VQPFTLESFESPIKKEKRKKIKYDKPKTKNASASDPIIAYKQNLMKKKQQKYHLQPITPYHGVSNLHFPATLPHIDMSGWRKLGESVAIKLAEWNVELRRDRVAWQLEIQKQ